MNAKWATLGFLTIVLLGCEREPPANKEFDPVTAAYPLEASREPMAPAVGDTPVAMDPVAAQAQRSHDYFHQSTQRAEERLQTAQQDCHKLEENVRDNCIGSATAVHESELAAARVEYEAQQAQEQAGGN